MRILFTEIAGSHAGVFLERPVKIAQIIEAAKRRNFNHALTAFRKQAFRIFQPDAELRLSNGFPRLLPVSGAEIDVGNPKLGGGLTVIKIRLKIVLQTGQDIRLQTGTPLPGKNE